MYVSLWERDADAVGVEGVVDTFQHVADDVRLLRRLRPDEQLEVHA